MFSLQQRLQERASTLRFTYIACLIFFCETEALYLFRYLAVIINSHPSIQVLL
jgi:hypothetical protein